MTPTLRRSYALCEQIARTKAANFYHAFRLLPRPQYLAMCALYTFLRVADDIADEPGDLDVNRRRIDHYREELDHTLTGRRSHPYLSACADTVHEHGIPVEYLYAALKGVSMDLDVSEYETFPQLYSYCYHVAS